MPRATPAVLRSVVGVRMSHLSARPSNPQCTGIRAGVCDHLWSRIVTATLSISVEPRWTHTRIQGTRIIAVPPAPDPERNLKFGHPHLRDRASQSLLGNDVLAWCADIALESALGQRQTSQVEAQAVLQRNPQQQIESEPC